MRKVKLAFLLSACIFIFGGCVAKDLPIKRKTNSANDVIKFYGFDWLTERSAIEKKLNGDFDSDYVCEENITHVNDQIDTVNVFYKGKNGTDLNWTIANHNVSQLQLFYIKSKSGKQYLYKGIWLFNHCNEEDEEYLCTKLDKLYPYTMKNKTLYIDRNNNQVSLSHTEQLKEISIDYCCTDILYQLNEEENNHSQESNDK